MEPVRHSRASLQQPLDSKREAANCRTVLSPSLRAIEQFTMQVGELISMKGSHMLDHMQTKLQQGQSAVHVALSVSSANCHLLTVIELIMAEEEDRPFKAEYAKSGRATCKVCKGSISKDTLRVAKMVQVCPMF